MSSSIPSSMPQPPPPHPTQHDSATHYVDHISFREYGTPTMYNLFVLSYEFFCINLRHMAAQSPAQFVNNIRKSTNQILETNPTIWYQFGALLVCAYILTKLRQSVTDFVIPNCLVRFDLIKPKDVNKVAESMFSSMFYGSTFLLTVYIVYEGQFITKPENIWAGWSTSAPVPPLVSLLYLLEISFYFHNMYAVFKINDWKKDSVILFVHHIVAATLLNLSYLTRVHRIGIMVLVFHDVCDVIMDTTKCLVKLNFKDPAMKKVLDTIRSVGFVMFLTAWFVLRLYYFPLWGLYQATIYLGETPDHWFPFMFLLYSFLWLIYAMNLYWASLIVFTTINVIRGGREQMDDIRDYDYPNDQPNQQQNRQQRQQQQQQQQIKSKSKKQN